jgi:hypothetical protein
MQLKMSVAVTACSNRLRKPASVFLFLSSLLLIAPSLADAEEGSVSLPMRDRLTVEPYAGTTFAVGGTVLREFSEVLTQSANVGGVPFSTALGFEVRERDFSDVFETPQEIGVQLNYGVSDLSELFGGVSYMRAAGKSFDALLFTFTGTLGGVPVAVGSTLFGEFEDYQEFAANAGFRRFLDLDSGFHPFVGASIGARKVSAIDLNFRHSSNGVVIDDVGFYKPSLAYMVGLQAGFRYDVSDAIALGVSTGVNYRSQLRQDDSEVSGFREFHNGNNDGDIIDIPVSVRLTAKF